jgi:uncharacterized paraquat-inducible protein A
MPLKENLIDVTRKTLIACRECSAVADVAINNSHVKLICPRCHRTLGSWVTTEEAVADLAAFVANSRASD